MQRPWASVTGVESSRESPEGDDGRAVVTIVLRFGTGKESGFFSFFSFIFISPRLITL